MDDGTELQLDDLRGRMVVRNLLAAADQLYTEGRRYGWFSPDGPETWRELDKIGRDGFLALVDRVVSVAGPDTNARSLRDWLAGMALADLASVEESVEAIARRAYRIADAMLKVRMDDA